MPCSRDLPFCVKRTDGDICSRIPDSECADEPPVSTIKFTCTSTGYFPDLTRCNLYHICSRSRPDLPLLPSTYACPSGYVFVPEKKLCRRQAKDRDCTKREINCANIDSQSPIQYSMSKQYYYYCRDDNEAVVFRCPDNSEYNAFDFECKYKCRKQGFFAHSDNPRRFFVCYIESRRLTSRIEECPENHTFDGVKKICVTSNL